MGLDIPETGLKRVVIIGGGFAGIEMAKELRDKFQIVLIDKNNYHTFQPLLYQVATAGIEPDSIVYPLRKVFAGYEHFHFRLAEVQEILADRNRIRTNQGEIFYDHLIIATGSDTSYFGMEELRRNSMPMKSVREALDLRSCILGNFERAVTLQSEEEREALMTYVITGGGPTGVELAGALAELKNHVLPLDYPELNFMKMKIHLLDSGPRLLAAMGEKSGVKAKEYLEKMDVNVWLNTRVTAYDGITVQTQSGTTIRSRTVIWAAGVMGNMISGIPAGAVVPGSRIKVNELNVVEGTTNIYAVGDVAYLENARFPKGHPQVAQVAMQQGRNLGRNLSSGKEVSRWKKFRYFDKGSMATIGRNKAVVETKFLKAQGTLAWFMWMFIHLLFLVGFRNRIVVFSNWLISYVNYDRGMRLIIRPFKRNN